MTGESGDWTVDLETRTARHGPTGLGFRFDAVPGKTGLVTVTLLGDPHGLGPLEVARLAYAAEAAYRAALRARH